jgi:exodeoxyribonuclease-3
VIKAMPNIKIATWNVNSVRARLEILKNWLSTQKPDIILLQETKCQDDQFPYEDIEDQGYNIAHFGQKTYNGVAILSKFPLEDIKKGLDSFDNSQARYIEAGVFIKKINTYLKVASVYVPNGQEVGSENYYYKLSFLDALKNHLHANFPLNDFGIIGGDFNIAPTNYDLYDAKLWHEKILCSTLERKAFFSILNQGFCDILGEKKPGTYTWWDYRALAFQKNNGMRLDHLLLTPPCADLIHDVIVDTEVRSLEKTSDHAPVIGLF